MRKLHDPIVTLTTRTPSGGLHLYFRWSPRLKLLGNDVKLFWNGKIIGIDLRGEGSQVVYAGSVYPGCGKKSCHQCSKCDKKGMAYEFENPDCPVAEMPDWLFAWIMDRRKK